jgi:hypothetical protein
MTVILRSLASDPAARYPDGTALRDALTSASDDARTIRRDEDRSRSSFPSLPTAFTSSPGFGTASLPPVTTGPSNHPSYPSAPAFPSAPGAPAFPGAGSPPVPARSPDPVGAGLSTLVRAGAAALLVIGVTVGVLVTVKPFGGGAPRVTDGSTQSRTEAAEPATGSTPGGKTVAGVDFGVDTTTDGCAAVGRDGTGGRCTKDAECWSSMVVVVGSVQITREPCAELHFFETFAIAPLPLDALTSNQKVLAKHPAVKKLCTRKVMMRSRLGAARKIPASKWMVEVLPPSDNAYQEGARVYRCVAAIIDGYEGTRGSVFTPPES